MIRIIVFLGFAICCFAPARLFAQAAAAPTIAEWIATLEAANTVAELSENLDKLIDGFQGSMAQQDGFKQAMSRVGTTETQLIELLNANGEKGLLIDVYIFERLDGAGQVQYAFAGMLPGGMGSSPEDAALKSYLAETTIEEMLPALPIAEKLLPEGFSPASKFSAYSFSIWLEKTGPDGLLVATARHDPERLYGAARQRWRLFQGSLIIAQAKGELQRLSAEVVAYQKLKETYGNRAYAKGVAGELEKLTKAQIEASANLSKAIEIREKAAERQRKWAGFATVATLFEIAGAVAGEFEARAQSAKAASDYMILEVHTKQNALFNNKATLNEFYMKWIELNVDQLPGL